MIGWLILFEWLSAFFILTLNNPINPLLLLLGTTNFLLCVCLKILDDQSKLLGELA